MDKKEIKWVCGNKLPLIIPLVSETATASGEVVIEDYPVPDGAKVEIVIQGNYNKYSFAPDGIEGNLVRVTVTENVPAGCYALEVRVIESDGTQHRFKQPCVIHMYDTNEEVTEWWDSFVDSDGMLIDAAIFYFAKGDTGADAGFGEVSATVDNAVGTPSVTVETSGPDVAKNIHFIFSHLKGNPGSDAEVTAQNISNALGYVPASEIDVEALAQQVREKYVKPDGGIPKSDLTSEIQTSLEKANTAIQYEVSIDPMNLFNI